MKQLIIDIYRKIFARKIFLKFNKVLFHLSLRGMGMLNSENYKISGESYFIENILTRIIKNDHPVLFDVGANTGSYSKMLLDSFPNATIYAFEPHPNNYLVLKQQLPSTKIMAHNIALGNISGGLPLYDCADWNGSPMASLHKEAITEIIKRDAASVDVFMDTLANFTKNHGITYIDFLKIDTEGSELAVLQGATKLVENKRIGCIHFEFNEMNIFSRVFFRDFRKLLPNYDLYRLLPNELLPLDNSLLLTEIFAYQNIIALPKI